MQRRQIKSKDVIEVDNKKIDFTLIKSNRKTISIEVNKDKGLVLRVPINTSREYIYTVIKEKLSWIESSREKIIKRVEMLEKESFIEGEKITFQGNLYTLKISSNELYRKTIVNINSECIIITTKSNEEDYVKDEYYKWCKDKLLKIIKDRIKIYEVYFSKKPLEIKVKEQKRRWGSCSIDNKLMFNWRLYKAPIEILDYVIIHEMCHMVHKNHSKEFWNEVKRILPDYKERDNWLKENGLKLMET